MEAFIKHISYYLPETTLTNNDLAILFPEWSAEKIAKKVGVNERRIASEEEFSSDLAIKAAEKLFEETKIDRTTIDFLIVCSETPEQLIPHISAKIQSKLSLPNHIGAMDINLGCSGYVYCLSVAKGLLAAGISKSILLITTDTYSKIIHHEDKGNRTIFGDAAAATLIGKEGSIKIGEFVFGTDGDGYNHIIWKGSGTKDFSNQIPHEERHLMMNGQSVFRFVADKVPQLVKEVLGKNQKKPSSINYYIFHQANKHMLTYVANKMDIEESKLVIDMEDFGNTTSSSIPIALANKKNQLIKGDQLIAAGFGVGYSWAGCLLSVN